MVNMGSCKHARGFQETLLRERSVCRKLKNVIEAINQEMTKKFRQSKGITEQECKAQRKAQWKNRLSEQIQIALFGLEKSSKVSTCCVHAHIHYKIFVPFRLSLYITCLETRTIKEEENECVLNL